MAENNTANKNEDWSITLNENPTNDNGTGGVTTEETEDGPVENKYNDMDPYWTPKEQEREFSSDTPDVRIYISREIVPESTEEGEEGTEGEEGKVTTLDEAIEINRNLAEIYSQDPDINNNNTSVVKLKGEQILAMNAIDKLDLKNAPK